MKPYRNISLLFLNYSDIQYSEVFHSNTDMRGFHTDVIDELTLKMHQKGIALISTTPEIIDYIGIVKKSGKVASKKSRIRIEYIKRFPSPIHIWDVVHNNEQNQFDFKTETQFDNITLIPNQIWNILIKKINQDIGNCETLKSSFEKFDKRQTLEDDKIEENNGFQKDGLGLILKCAGFDTQSINLSDYDIRNDSMPDFLRNLGKQKIREDLMIINDSTVFDDWKIIDKNLVCTTLSDGKKQLSIMYTNRLKLEETLGVDLIYIDENNKSMIFVQYKRLTGTKKKQYTPKNDKNFDKEMISIENITQRISEENDKGYRFNSCPFYFKLCNDIQSVQTRKLVDGMYIPVELMNYLIKSQMEHNQGRITLSYETVPNYFTNTIFTELIKTGLIGCSVSSYHLLGEIIKETISNGKAVILGKYESLTAAALS